MESVDCPDYIVPSEFFNTTFEEVEDNALVFMITPPKKWANLKDCGDFPCTGPLNTQIRLEGTKFTGKIRPIINLPTFWIIPNNGGFANDNDDSCAYGIAYNGWICAGYKKLGVLLFESLDEDKMDRSM